LTKRPFKIGVAGTHSTGKSTFVRCVDEALAAEGMAIAKVNDLATRASALGSIALGEGRDTDEGFRAAADRHVTAVMKEFAPHAVVMTADDAPRIIHDTIALARKGGSATN
jgi:molybdopterin-guanine dinucleotide biosynthesis protein